MRKLFHSIGGIVNPTRASHDINNVHTIKFNGWSGEVTFETHDSKWVEIQNPKRHEGDSWVFSKQEGGILSCNNQLISSPNLLSREPSNPMTISLPNGKYKSHSQQGNLITVHLNS
jgi:hypothetical protein